MISVTHYFLAVTGMFALGCIVGYVICQYRAQRQMEELAKHHWKNREALIGAVTMVSGDIIDAIDVVNTDRNFENLHRRLIKLGEEYGEASEAYLASTSSRSYKKLTYADLREELADTVIVAVDLALTRTPDQIASGLTTNQAKSEFANIIGRKLLKWVENRQRGLVMTDAE
jgi:hypothetical protein